MTKVILHIKERERLAGLIPVVYSSFQLHYKRLVSGRREQGFWKQPVLSHKGLILRTVNR